MTETQSHDPQSGIADALGQLSEETRMLVRQELDRGRQELFERAKELAPSLGLLALGGGMGLAAAASGYRLVLRILERMSTPAVAAFLATAGFGAGAAVALKAGVAQLQDAPLPFPVSTATQAAQDAAATVQQARERAG